MLELPTRDPCDLCMIAAEERWKIIDESEHALTVINPWQFEVGQCCVITRRHVATLSLTGTTRLFRRDATRMGAPTMEPFDLIFCDPPYGKDLAAPALKSCAEGGWLREGALILVEEAENVAFTPPEGFTLLERRVYGDTAIHFLRYA